MSKVVLYKKKIDKYTVECTKNNYDADITKFVAEIYFNKPHFSFTEEFKKILEIMLEEDKLYKDNSIIITVYNEDNEIQGTVRKIYSTDQDVLPIEREFDIDLLKIIKNNLPIHNVCEIARFANKDNDIKALKILLTELIANSNRNDLFLASLDSKVLRRARKLGFPWHDIGKPKEYLGSLTCPVALTMSKVSGDLSYKHASKHKSINDIYENAI